MSSAGRSGMKLRQLRLLRRLLLLPKTFAISPCSYCARYHVAEYKFTAVVHVILCRLRSREVALPCCCQVRVGHVPKNLRRRCIVWGKRGARSEAGDADDAVWLTGVLQPKCLIGRSFFSKGYHWVTEIPEDKVIKGRNNNESFFYYSPFGT